MSADMKLSFLLTFLFMGMSLLTFLIVMRSIGGITHSLDRIDTLMRKEVVLTYNRRVSELKQSRQRDINAQEKQRRREALLNIPLMMKRSNKKKAQDPGEEL